MQEGWIGVDLDGTLVRSGDWRDPEYVGAPIAGMRDRVKEWLAEGRDVRIFTARVAPLFQPDASRAEQLQAQKALWAIEDWCAYHFGEKLRVTAVKDFGMALLYDDRCVSVETDTGRLLTDEIAWHEDKPKDIQEELADTRFEDGYPEAGLWENMTGQARRLFRKGFVPRLSNGGGIP